MRHSSGEPDEEITDGVGVRRPGMRENHLEEFFLRKCIHLAQHLFGSAVEDQSRGSSHHNSSIDGVELEIECVSERYVGIHSGVYEELCVIHLVNVIANEGRHRQTVFIDHVFRNGVIRPNITEDSTHLIEIHAHMVDLGNRAQRRRLDVRTQHLDPQ